MVAESAWLPLGSIRYPLRKLAIDVSFCSAPEICFGEINELVVMPAENRFQRKQAKPL
jgi:hypothetical protein